MVNFAWLLKPSTTPEDNLCDSNQFSSSGSCLSSVAAIFCMGSMFHDNSTYGTINAAKRIHEEHCDRPKRYELESTMLQLIVTRTLLSTDRADGLRSLARQKHKFNFTFFGPTCLAVYKALLLLAAHRFCCDAISHWPHVGVESPIDARRLGDIGRISQPPTTSLTFRGPKANSIGMCG